MTTKLYVFTRQDKKIWHNKRDKLNKDIFNLIEKNKKEDKNLIIALIEDMGDKETEELRRMYE